MGLVFSVLHREKKINWPVSDSRRNSSLTSLHFWNYICKCQSKLIFHHFSQHYSDKTVIALQISASHACL